MSLFIKINKLIFGHNIKRFYFSSIDQIQKENLQKIFSKYNRQNYRDYLIKKNPEIAKLKRAAVLVPISIKEELDSNGQRISKSFLTLSKRSEKVNFFKGQTCFIGGNFDHDDLNEVETAFREAKEEVGIEKDQLELVAQLCPIVTSFGALVTPVVVYFNNSNFIPNLNKDEVDLIFEIQTTSFLSKNNYSHTLVRLENDEFIIHNYDFLINNTSINITDLTAMIAIMTCSMLHSKLPDYMFDTQLPLTIENLEHYIDLYLLNKCKALVKATTKNNDKPGRKTNFQKVNKEK